MGMDGNKKVLSIGALVGFIVGVLVGWKYEKVQAPLKAYGFCFLGSYLFFYGVSCYLGGFTKTKWSIYVYGLLIIVAFVARGYYSAKDASAAMAKESINSTDEMANQEEGYHGS